MLKSFLIFAVLLIVGPQAVPPPTVPATTAIPPEAVHMTNPGKSTPESVAHAKKMYGYDCAMCHGENGNGKGDFAVQSKLAMKDWTDPAVLKGKTDGELYYIISKGQGSMPAEGERAKPEDMWNMVVMIRSFAKP
jgi:mono/diheme cytochrome c family protein